MKKKILSKEIFGGTVLYWINFLFLVTKVFGIDEHQIFTGVDGPQIYEEIE